MTKTTAATCERMDEPMVKATVYLRDGQVLTVTANDFIDLYASLKDVEQDIVQIIGRTIRVADMRQGKE